MEEHDEREAAIEAAADRPARDVGEDGPGGRRRRHERLVQFQSRNSGAAAASAAGAQRQSAPQRLDFGGRSGRRSTQIRRGTARRRRRRATASDPRGRPGPAWRNRLRLALAVLGERAADVLDFAEAALRVAADVALVAFVGSISRVFQPLDAPSVAPAATAMPGCYLGTCRHAVARRGRGASSSRTSAWRVRSGAARAACAPCSSACAASSSIRSTSSARTPISSHGARRRHRARRRLPAPLPGHAFEHFAKERCILPASAFPCYREQGTARRRPGGGMASANERVPPRSSTRRAGGGRASADRSRARELTDHGTRRADRLERLEGHGEGDVDGAGDALDALRRRRGGRTESGAKLYDVPERAFGRQSRSQHRTATSIAGPLRERVARRRPALARRRRDWSMLSNVRTSPLLDG